MRPIDQCFLRQHELLTAEIVAETISQRFERRKGFNVGLLLRRVHTSRRERDLHVVASRLRSLFDGGATSEHNQGGERDFLAARLRSVELLLDGFKLLKNRCYLRRLIDGPILLRGEAEARAIGAATLVRAAIGRCRRPRRSDQLRDGQSADSDGSRQADAAAGGSRRSSLSLGEPEAVPCRRTERVSMSAALASGVSRGSNFHSTRSWRGGCARCRPGLLRATNKRKRCREGDYG